MAPLTFSNSLFVDNAPTGSSHSPTTIFSFASQPLKTLTASQSGNHNPKPIFHDLPLQLRALTPSASAKSPEASDKTGTENATSALASGPDISGDRPNKTREKCSATDDEDDEDSISESESESETEDEDALFARHLEWLKPTVQGAVSELESAPLFTWPVLRHARKLHKADGTAADKPFSQHGLLGSCAEISASSTSSSHDPRLFYNVSAPSSAFICGSQGSGKSHTLSCLLENSLVKSGVSHLPRPLTGLLFHYDTFVSDVSIAPCEAAYLSSHHDVAVRVLCSPTNFHTMKRTYARLPNVRVEELRLNEADLNTKRMMELMAVGTRSMPLYMHVVQRILRDLRLDQQEKGTPFSYHEFRERIMSEDWRTEQLAPLLQRLETLESFLPRRRKLARNASKLGPSSPSTSWIPKEGQLTVVDLSCPCICLSIFLEQDTAIGRVVALDEAHKYMGDSAECDTLTSTNTLLSTIRLQRHLGTRVIISTQEPSISPKLLDLCSMTIVHRFTSPDWMRVLRSHLAGTSTMAQLTRYCEKRDGEAEASDEGLLGLNGSKANDSDLALELFSQIVELKTGEALVFAPNAIVDLKQRKVNGEIAIIPNRLAHHILRVPIRRRVTKDGGESIMAS
ncbi:hypothetical protein GGR57DRAFT_490152 [Xylariaceae sp. FL1272]|nr:hypothetical protein GGR57DRAFT_490152 [Xylariaceae sp. FL1272]